MKQNSDAHAVYALCSGEKGKGGRGQGKESSQDAVENELLSDPTGALERALHHEEAGHKLRQGLSEPLCQRATGIDCKGVVGMVKLPVQQLPPSARNSCQEEGQL